MRWYRKAVEQAQGAEEMQGGIVEANFKLGEMFEWGRGVAKDERQAIERYRIVAGTNVLASFNLGWMLEHGRGVAKDERQAAEWFRKAAELKYALAQYNLGLLLEYGRGIAKDDRQAADWYRKAAEQGYPPAQFKFGEMLANGLGVVKDEAHAAEWYQKAAKYGYAEVGAKELPKDGASTTASVVLETKAIAEQQKSDTDSASLSKHSLSIAPPVPPRPSKRVLPIPTINTPDKSTLHALTDTEPQAIAQRPKEQEEIKKQQEILSAEMARKAEEAKLAAEKVWHFDVNLKPGPETFKESYTLIPAGDKDLKKVMEAYSHNPVPGYDIGRVQIIYNSELNRTFAGRLRLLQSRHDSVAFQPKWATENEGELRGAIHTLFEKMTAAYQDKDCPNVKLIPVWHGTKPEILPSLFKAGFASLALVDAGYFGKGIYGPYEAEYSHRVYSKGALLLNWCSVYSAYPVIDGDMLKLEGRANFANYDAHFAPMLPEDLLDPHPESYVPCKPGQRPHCAEIVVFDSAQMLPRYLVELQASLLKTPSVSVPEKTSGNSAVLYAYLASEWQAKAKAKPDTKGQVKKSQAKKVVI